jgi:hypothetical protein
MGSAELQLSVCRILMRCAPNVLRLSLRNDSHAVLTTQTLQASLSVAVQNHPAEYYRFSCKEILQFAFNMLVFNPCMYGEHLIHY